ncbi:hypothetical protein MHF_0399 [Mycoplasma haemofelis Ohio2]|uniref:Uncharacterized protein n=1 Tax=Mycoplasma haemofelis (strain Ohio2) TaxID=859194 RepID=F6FH70_MYCHI|nr:hypothetical protein MHF_0399 [Mycoplasma haemofelis Ohio2]
MESKNLQLISSLNSDAQWKAEYEIDKEAVKALIEGTNDNNGGVKLKEWCESELSKTFKEGDDLKTVTRWCTIGKISQRIPKGKTLLDTKASNNTEWETIYNKHTGTEDRNILNLSAVKGDTTKADDLTRMKQFCEENQDKDFLVSKKVNEYDLVIKWCTK